MKNLDHYFFDIVAAKSLQSYLTLCDPIDGSRPGSVLRGILQARTLEWVAMPSLFFDIISILFSPLLFSEILIIHKLLCLILLILGSVIFGLNIFL